MVHLEHTSYPCADENLLECLEHQVDDVTTECWKDFDAGKGCKVSLLEKLTKVLRHPLIAWYSCAKLLRCLEEDRRRRSAGA